jgi:hypothetical protein
MSVLTYSQPPGRNKMRLGRGKACDVSMVSLPFRTHFLIPGRSKARLLRGRESSVSLGRQALSAYFPVKFPLRRVGESDVSRVRLTL